MIKLSVHLSLYINTTEEFAKKYTHNEKVDIKNIHATFQGMEIMRVRDKAFSKIYPVDDMISIRTIPNMPTTTLLVLIDATFDVDDNIPCNYAVSEIQFGIEEDEVKLANIHGIWSEIGDNFETQDIHFYGTYQHLLDQDVW